MQNIDQAKKWIKNFYNKIFATKATDKNINLHKFNNNNK